MSGPIRVEDRVLAALDLLRDRAPDVVWHPGRIAQAARDFPELDPVEVAGEVADWIRWRSSGKIADGPSTYRRFCSGARARARVEGLDITIKEGGTDVDLRVYDRFEA